ncbi:MAG TPA: hypothetical protein VJ724_04260, partial [Tahibacter sp.]|nr:hypothetical protein [Tahibacter sp.]
LNPTKADRERDGKAGKFPMPKEQDTRAEFAAEVGAAFAGDADGAELAYQAARAYYAGAAARRGDLSGEYNTNEWRQAVRAATGGTTDFNGRGDVLLPWGMPEDTFADQAEQAFTRSAQAAGLKDVALDDYGLQTLADGRYLVRDGTGYLLTPAGAPLVIDVYGNTQTAVPQRVDTAAALVRGVRR